MHASISGPANRALRTASRCMKASTRIVSFSGTDQPIHFDCACRQPKRAMLPAPTFADTNMPCVLSHGHQYYLWCGTYFA
jgi:hypothetical protein